MRIDGRTPFEFLVSYMGFCNNMSVKPREEWPRYLNYDFLDSTFGKFSREELEIMVDGEDVESHNLMKSNGLEHEDLLLNSLFDGDLHEHFYLGAQR